MKVSLITLRPDSFDFGVTTLHHAIVFYYLEDDFLPGCNDIFLMHRLLGTPNEQVWPGVSKLVNWHEYPQWKPQPLSSSVPNLDENGLNLLAVSLFLLFLLELDCGLWLCKHNIYSLYKFVMQEMLHYEPSRRISAKKAMEHPYFDDLDKSYL